MNVIISGILPSRVTAAEALVDDPMQPLMPDEEALLAGACEERRREFTTARSCARRALSRLGVGARPILSGKQREPLWPAAVVGSITHCPGYRAAVVAWKKHFLSIGVDAEIHENLPSGIARIVMLKGELESLGRAGAGVCWDRVLFSAKESTYKAWFPITKQWLDFHEIMISVNPKQGTFRAWLQKPCVTAGGEQMHHFDGHFLVESGLILTFVGLKARVKMGEASEFARELDQCVLQVT